MIEVTLQHADTPPSLNRIATRGNHWPVTRAKKAWQGIFEILLMQKRLPRAAAAVHATASLRFPTRHRRDEGNYRWILEKSLGDALTNGRWLPDDDADRFTFGEVTFEPDRGSGRTTVRLKIQE